MKDGMNRYGKIISYIVLSSVIIFAALTLYRASKFSFLILLLPILISTLLITLSGLPFSPFRQECDNCGEDVWFGQVVCRKCREYRFPVQSDRLGQITTVVAGIIILIALPIVIIFVMGYTGWLIEIGFQKLGFYRATQVWPGFASWFYLSIYTYAYVLIPIVISLLVWIGQRIKTS